MIKNWSYTKLIDFEQCPYRVKLKHIDRLPEAKAPAAERPSVMRLFRRFSDYQKANRSMQW